MIDHYRLHLDPLINPSQLKWWMNKLPFVSPFQLPLKIYFNSFATLNEYGKMNKLPFKLPFNFTPHFSLHNSLHFTHRKVTHWLTELLEDILRCYRWVWSVNVNLSSQIASFSLAKPCLALKPSLSCRDGGKQLYFLDFCLFS